jgi:hypothetical protein
MFNEKLNTLFCSYHRLLFHKDREGPSYTVTPLIKKNTPGMKATEYNGIKQKPITKKKKEQNHYESESFSMQHNTARKNIIIIGSYRSPSGVLYGSLAHLIHILAQLV